MRPKTTLVLLAVTLALIGFIVFFEPDTTRVSAENKSKVVRFETGEVTRIEISGSHGTALLQKKKDGIWYLEKPFADRLNPQLIEKMLEEAGNLDIFETLSPKELKKEGIKPDDFGFGKDKLTIRFSKADEELAAIEIGDLTELKDISYIRETGDWDDVPVHAAWGLVRDVAEMPFDEMRDPNLLHAGSEEIREIKFVGGQASVLVKWDLERERWMMEKPIHTRANKQAIDEKLASLLATKIEDFLDESEPGAADAFQEAPREIRVWFHHRRGSVDIQLAQPPAAAGADIFYAKVSDRKGIFKLPKTILDAYTVNPNDLRDRNLGDFDEDEISAIVIKQQKRDGTIERPIRLENYEGNWALLRNSQREKADSAKVSKMIKEVNEEQIIEFVADAAVDLSQYALDKPIHSISFFTRVITIPDDPDSKEPAKIEDKSKTLLISSPPDGRRVFAKYEDEPFIYRIAPHLYGFFETNATINWKSPEILRFNMLALKGMSIERHPNPPINLIYDVATNSWGAESGGEDLTPRLIRSRAQAILQRLSNFQSEGFTSDIGTANRLIKQSPLLTIRLEIDNKEENKVERVKLVVAPTAAGKKGASFYGQINDTPDFFYINRESVVALISPLLKKEDKEEAGASDED